MKNLLGKLSANTPALLALVTLPLALLIAGLSWYATPAARADGPTALSPRGSESTYWRTERGREGPKERPDRGERRERRDHRRGGKHHGPPPPPPVPPTIIFLVGGGLGYLIGRRRSGCCGSRRQQFRPDYYPAGHPAHQQQDPPQS